MTGAAGFNESFYSTAATIIPVLFIALLFAGGPLRPYALWVKRWHRHWLRRVILAEPKPRWWVVRAAVVSRIKDLLQLVVSLVFLAASVGEASALLALDHRHATLAEHSYVLWSVIGLPFLAAIVVMFGISFESVGGGKAEPEELERPSAAAAE